MLGEMINSFFDGLGGGDRASCFEVLKAYGLPTVSGYWWTSYPERAVKEIYMMQENTNAILNRHKDRLLWDEVIVTNFGGEFRFSINTYPGFPYKMPKVFVLEPCVGTGASRHVYEDESLCLFKPEFYYSSMSILEIRNLACAWCFCYEAYQDTGEWPGAEEKH